MPTAKPTSAAMPIYLPRIIAHEAVGLLADLLRLIAQLRRRIRHRAFCGRQGDLYLGPNIGNVG